MIIIVTTSRQLVAQYDYYKFLNFLNSNIGEFIEVLEVKETFEFDGIVEVKRFERLVTISKKHIVEVINV